jgi:hypothetical protein
MDYKTRRELIENAVGRMPPFKPELREKIRLGLKTQTRRPLKTQPVGGIRQSVFSLTGFETVHGDGIHCPYPGGIRYMIEPLMKGKDNLAHYRDDGAMVFDRYGGAIHWRWQRDYLTSIHMPADAPRYFVNWQPYKLQNIQKISEEDAQAEGVEVARVNLPHPESGFYLGAALQDYRAVFRFLWNSINAKRGFSWEDNPVVWAYKWQPVVLEK